MTKFNVGDLVVAHEGTGFTVTNEFALLKVTNPMSDEFSAELVAHQATRMKDFIGRTYDSLSYDDFEIATEEQIERIQGSSASGSKKKKAKGCKTITIGPLEINIYEDGGLESNFNKDFSTMLETDDKRITALSAIAKAWDKKTMTTLYDIENVDVSPFEDLFGEKARLETANGFIKFFIQYNFNPSVRFSNTLYFKLWQEGIKAGKKYTENYFTLCNSPYATDVKEKIKSPEYDMLLKKIMLLKVDSKNRVNQRLKIYFGPAGTGKTTKAIEEAANDAVVVCHSSVLPQDIFEDFDFKDGKPTFKGSVLKEGLQKGWTVVLDEISNLPFETLRFLQGILDGKKVFTYKGETIKVHKDFNIIGTMNLMVNGMVFGMPEPLVDRCYDIQEFVLDGKQLLSILEA